MSGTIYVINPNSNESVTAGIDAAVAPLRSADGPAIACVTLLEGPPGIQSQRDVDGIVGPLLKQAAVARERGSGLRRSLLLRPRHACPARAECAARPGHCRVRRPDGPDARPAVRRHCDPADLDPASSSLFRRHGRDSTGSPPICPSAWASPSCPTSSARSDA